MAEKMYEITRNRPNQEILVPHWLITSHVTSITSSDWSFTCFGRFLIITWDIVTIRASAIDQRQFELVTVGILNGEEMKSRSLCLAISVPQKDMCLHRME
eukprot:sb/3478680/